MNKEKIKALNALVKELNLKTLQKHSNPKKLAYNTLRKDPDIIDICGVKFLPDNG